MKKVAPFIKQSLRSLLDYSLDSLSCSFIIKLFNYSTNRLNGRQYDSYSLEDEAALALSFLGPSSNIIIDAGANTGSWTLTLLNKNISQIDRLIMIEPQHLLSKDLSPIQNKYDCVDYLQKGLGAEASKAILYSDKQGSTLASMSKRNLSHFDIEMSISEYIDVITLDSLAQSFCLPHISYLKLDWKALS